ncbi:nitrite reductase large subunit NirB [Rubrobacter indicoceani]|uniref:nitrite reductase large subunit NirB n=1 Tax=Rubrobacter indicoceani TaxID=2051957 RepID=UPI000E5B3059|nr:nitrite reductase large subunit NirB [Rubrobacter indicoceani]
MSEKDKTPMRITVVGNGNAGAALVDSLLARGGEGVRITVYGDEHVGAYDRIRLSEYMAGEIDLEGIGLRGDEWYERNGVRFRRGVRVEEIDTTAKQTRGTDGDWVAYDRLILATGSSSSVPKIPGQDKKGVFVFRTVRDVEEMLEASPKKAVVIGGGLLGLEAAYGLINHEADVTVLHRSPHLMNQQLDPTAGRMLTRKVEELGIKVRTKANTDEILGNGGVEGVRLTDGRELEADMVVICTGIDPNVHPARGTLIAVNNGILVNEYMETNVEGVYAVGECTEFQGQLIGLVAPALEQVRVVVDTILGGREQAYGGSGAATKLKVAGLDLVSAGDACGRDEGSEEIVSSDPISGVYRKAVIKDGKVTGTVLLGDASISLQMTAAVKRGAPAEEVVELITGTVNVSGMELNLPDEAQVCDCNGVSKGQIVATIESLKLRKLSDVIEKTKAGRSCGTCKPLVGKVLEGVVGEVEVEKNYTCRCQELTAEDLRTMIKSRNLRSVSEIGETCGAGKSCQDCKPALTYLVSSTNLGKHREERHARHINDRVHANIQNDGTFSVVPRTRGGITTPDELRRIADVAERYSARMVKITGSQRLDILGVKKEDLPKAWEDLGMPSGNAYGKAFRQVKTCVGTDFCRFGVGDSTKLGVEIEKELEFLYTPAKVKMAASGCPRNCAESSVKDIGLIAVEGGWQVYVGGAAGLDVRKGDVIATARSEQEAKDITMAFMQFYRENGHPKERTYDFVPRIGLEKLRKIILDKDSGEPERLCERLRAEKAETYDPWLERTKNKTNNQFAEEVGV